MTTYTLPTSLSINEGDNLATTLIFTVERSGDLPAQTVRLETSDITGVAATGDYLSASARDITFLEGQTSQEITLQIIGDTDVEPDETFNVSLTRYEQIDGEWVNVTLADSTVTIVNDDTADSAIATSLEVNGDTELGQNAEGHYQVRSPDGALVTLTQDGAPLSPETKPGWALVQAEYNDTTGGYRVLWQQGDDVPSLVGNVSASGAYFSEYQVSGLAWLQSTFQANLGLSAEQKIEELSPGGDVYTVTSFVNSTSSVDSRTSVYELGGLTDQERADFLLGGGDAHLFYDALKVSETTLYDNGTVRIEIPSTNLPLYSTSYRKEPDGDYSVSYASGQYGSVYRYDVTDEFDWAVKHETWVNYGTTDWRKTTFDDGSSLEETYGYRSGYNLVNEAVTTTANGDIETVNYSEIWGPSVITDYSYEDVSDTRDWALISKEYTADDASTPAEHISTRIDYDDGSHVVVDADLYTSVETSGEVDLWLDGEGNYHLITAAGESLAITDRNEPVNVDSVPILHVEARPSSEGYVWVREKAGDGPAYSPGQANELAQNGLYQVGLIMPDGDFVGLTNWNAYVWAADPVAVLEATFGAEFEGPTSPPDGPDFAIELETSGATAFGVDDDGTYVLEAPDGELLRLSRDGDRLTADGADLIHAEYNANNGGYRVLWQNDGDGPYTVGNVNSSGIYFGEYTTNAKSWVESTFATTLDDTTEPVFEFDVETSGDTSFGVNDDGVYVVETPAGELLTLSRGGAALTDDAADLIHAEYNANNGGYRVLWENDGEGPYLVGNVNANGVYFGEYEVAGTGWLEQVFEAEIA